MFHLCLLKASKAAMLIFFETLRVELGGDIGITIVTPGLIESELTKGKFLSKEGKMVIDQEMRDVSYFISFLENSKLTILFIVYILYVPEQIIIFLL